MDAVYLSIALVAVSVTALVGAYWFRAALSEATHRAERAERLAGSRTLAQRLIAAGRVRAAELPVRKPAELLADDVPLAVAPGPEDRFVSRGGLKLAGALATSGVSVTGQLPAGFSFTGTGSLPANWTCTSPTPTNASFQLCPNITATLTRENIPPSTDWITAPDTASRMTLIPLARSARSPEV